MNNQIDLLEILRQLAGQSKGMGIGDNAYFHRTINGLSKSVNNVFNSPSFQIQKRSCNALMRVFSSRSVSEMMRHCSGFWTILRYSCMMEFSSPSLKLSFLMTMNQTADSVLALMKSK